MMYYAHDGGWWWFMAITSTIFWVAVIAAVVALAAYVLRSMETPGPSRHSTARAILDERFARGEITAEEYRERLRTIGGGSDSYTGSAA